VITELFTHPAVRKYANCICFVLTDPFAVLFRGAADRKVVIPAMERARAVKRPRNGDVLLFWDDLDKEGGSYHAAIAQGDKCYQLSGVNGEFIVCRGGQIQNGGGDKYQYRKRARRFSLPLLHDTPRVREIYDTFNDKNLTAEQRVDFVVETMKQFDAYITRERGKASA